MNNAIKFRDLPVITDLGDVDKIIVGTSVGTFGVITVADLRICLVNADIVSQRIAESLPEGEIIATYNRNEENTN